MREAAGKLVGEHDFRNLCKMDVGNGVTNFKRRILHTELSQLDQMYVDQYCASVSFCMYHSGGVCVCVCV